MKCLSRCSLRVVILCFGAVLVGCSSGDLGRVSGKVTLDDQPLADAEITFTPIEGGRPSIATTDSSGAYELLYTKDQKGAVVGPHTITITTYEESDDQVTREEKVPTKYNLETTLKETVKAGSQTLDFELDSKGKIAKTPAQRGKVLGETPGGGGGRTVDLCGGWDDYLFDDDSVFDHE